MASPLACFAAAAALLLVPLAASAQESSTPTPPPRDPWTRHAIHAGAGAGYIADIGEPTMNARVLAVLALGNWGGVEGGFSGMRFSALDHHGVRSTSTGLGLNLGFRLAPFRSELFRPYAAARLTHIHLSPDLWGKHEHAGTTDVHDHESVHRFGAAFGLGVEAAPTEHLRLGLDAEALALSGPGANVGLQSLLTIGFAL